MQAAQFVFTSLSFLYRLLPYTRRPERYADHLPDLYTRHSPSPTMTMMRGAVNDRLFWLGWRSLLVARQVETEDTNNRVLVVE